ncbi:MAG: hypothetical protein HQK83_08955 [Fibrobacteria bacterium]|nr:hypothetical protein [Fibrobacteria bacterium]
MKKMSVYLLVIGLMTGLGYSSSIEVSDTIKVNTTWDADTVKVVDSVLLLEEASLTINSGTKIIFYDQSNIICWGTFIANGTKQDSIIFTAADTAVGRNNLVLFSTQESELSYCRLEFGKNSDKGGAIVVRAGANVLIKYSVFYKNESEYGGAIYNYSDKLVVDSCVFIENSAKHGGAIQMGRNKVNILNSHFYNNYASLNGGAININNTASTNVYTSIFKGNRAKSSGGAVYVQDQAAIFFINNLVVENSAFNGAGIACLEASPYIINNTIYGNSASGHGGGVHMDVSSPKIYNTIVSGNSASYNGDDLYEDNGNPRIDKCLIGVEINFTDVEKGDYSLSPMSPAIDSGRDTAWLRLPDYDLASNPRVSGGRIDIGAYEYQDTTTSIFNNSKLPEEKYRVEAINGFVRIRVFDLANINFLEIRDFSGVLVRRLKPENEDAFVWNGLDESGNRVKPGIYMFYTSGVYGIISYV